MGITIGDSLTVVSLVAALGLSTWATLVAITLLLPTRSQQAQRALTQRTGASFGYGLVVGIAFLMIGIILLNVPNPIAKILGIGVFGSWMLLMGLGAAGLIRELQSRMHSEDSHFSGLLALVRGATWVVLSTMLPFIGWFFIGPLMIVACTGAGALTFGRAARTAPSEA